MISRTFQHLPGIGQRTERNLWNDGIIAWSGIRDRCPSRFSRNAFLAAIDRSEEALASRDIAYFGRSFPAREAWRIYYENSTRASFIDIETTGSARGVDSITCIAVATNDRLQMFVKGRNLADFPDAIGNTPMIVTFNGTSFDLPFLKDTFGPHLFARHAHFDVCHALRRIGFSGGLKKIEVDAAIPRAPMLDGIDGMAAVWLWQRHLAGDSRAVAALERYCSEDVLGLPALAAIAANGLLQQTPFHDEIKPLPVPRRIEAGMPCAPEILEEFRHLKYRTGADDTFSQFESL